MKNKFLYQTFQFVLKYWHSTTKKNLSEIRYYGAGYGGWYLPKDLELKEEDLLFTPKGLKE